MTSVFVVTFLLPRCLVVGSLLMLGNECSDRLSDHMSRVAPISSLSISL